MSDQWLDRDEMEARKKALTLTRMERVYRSTHEAPTGFAGLKRNIGLIRDRQVRAEAWKQRDPLERPVPPTAYQLELDARQVARMDQLIDHERPLASKLKRMAERARARKEESKG